MQAYASHVMWRAVHPAEFIDFHRDVTQSPLHLFSSYLGLTRTHTCTHAGTHAAASSLLQGLCCGGAAECHLTNEFLLTSRSPLKNLFALRQRCAELPPAAVCVLTHRHLLSAIFCYLMLSLSLPPIHFSCNLIRFHENLDQKLTKRPLLMEGR